MGSCSGRSQRADLEAAPSSRGGALVPRLLLPHLLLLLVCVRPLLAAALCFCSTGASTGVRIKANPGVAPSVWTSCVLLRPACGQGLLGPGLEPDPGTAVLEAVLRGRLWLCVLSQVQLSYTPAPGHPSTFSGHQSRPEALTGLGFSHRGQDKNVIN